MFLTGLLCESNQLRRHGTGRAKGRGVFSSLLKSVSFPAVSVFVLNLLFYIDLISPFSVFPGCPNLHLYHS